MNAIILKGAVLRQPPLPQSGSRAKTIAHPCTTAMDIIKNLLVGFSSKKELPWTGQKLYKCIFNRSPFGNRYICYNAFNCLGTLQASCLWLTAGGDLRGFQFLNGLKGSLFFVLYRLIHWSTALNICDPIGWGRTRLSQTPSRSSNWLLTGKLYRRLRHCPNRLKDGLVASRLQVVCLKWSVLVCWCVLCEVVIAILYRSEEISFQDGGWRQIGEFLLPHRVQFVV
jgi:hypothetical protein